MSNVPNARRTCPPRTTRPLLNQYAFLTVSPAVSNPGLTSPAKPGELVVLFGNGFGLTSTPAVSGSPTQSGSLSPLPVVKIAGIAATVQYAGLSAPGEFQFNVVAPASTPDGDQPITATYNGFSTQAGASITVQH